MKERAAALLREMFGPEARFRDGQWEAIEAVVRQRGRVLVIQRTGWGKSLVYFLATRLLQDAGGGATLLISPLLSLMRNQVEMARRLGVRAATINSTNPDDWGGIERQLAAGECDILLVSPERLASRRFMRHTLPRIRDGIGLLVVDEAHCISDWGHDFRPDYQRIGRLLRTLPQAVPVLCTTATANERVIADILEQMGPDLRILRGPLGRETLRLQAVPLLDQPERLAWLAEHLPLLPGTGIIYCLTTADCRRVSEWLLSRGIYAPAYYADLETTEKEILEDRLLNNQVKALVATIALGMGFDKPDLGFVVHFQRPGSVVGYYQQVGRAGRTGGGAPGILLNGREDDLIQEELIRRSFPEPGEAEEILAAIEESGSITLPELLRRVNRAEPRVEVILRRLAVDGAVAWHAGRYHRTKTPWSPDTARARRVMEQRYGELERMRDYVSHSGCLMEFLTRELDDPAAAPCGRCGYCAEPPASSAVQPWVVRQAASFLRRSSLAIPPRREWPLEGDGRWAGPIPELLRNREGRALCVYGDAGWGHLVARGKYQAGRFADELVAATVELLRSRWNPDPFPAWVTAVPSLRHPTLVPDFARRVAAALRIPFFPLLVKVRNTPAQKEMRNSLQQAENVASAFAVRGRCPGGPVLLIDDITDSRWTLAVCGALLREAGSGTVYPFALALAAGGGDPP